MACRHLLVLAVLAPGATAAAAEAGEREKGRETEWGGTKGREGRRVQRQRAQPLPAPAAAAQPTDLL
jgi:hypothetical protein